MMSEYIEEEMKIMQENSEQTNFEKEFNVTQTSKPLTDSNILLITASILIILVVGSIVIQFMRKRMLLLVKKEL